jgi:hypothetical protein
MTTDNQKKRVYFHYRYPDSKGELIDRCDYLDLTPEQLERHTESPEIRRGEFVRWLTDEEYKVLDRQFDEELMARIGSTKKLPISTIR